MYIRCVETQFVPHREQCLQLLHNQCTVVTYCYVCVLSPPPSAVVGGEAKLFMVHRFLSSLHATVSSSLWQLCATVKNKMFLGLYLMCPVFYYFLFC
jgi:hypothetical protein